MYVYQVACTRYNFWKHSDLCWKLLFNDLSPEITNFLENTAHFSKDAMNLLLRYVHTSKYIENDAFSCIFWGIFHNIEWYLCLTYYLWPPNRFSLISRVWQVWALSQFPLHIAYLWKVGFILKNISHRSVIDVSIHFLTQNPVPYTHVKAATILRVDSRDL